MSEVPEMPIFELKCSKCGKQFEQYFNRHEELPTCCGQEMTKLLGVPVVARTTKGGNLIYSSANSKWKGNYKPKQVYKGHGLGGRRKPPSIKDYVLSQQVANVKGIGDQKTTMRLIDEKKAKVRELWKQKQQP